MAEFDAEADLLHPVGDAALPVGRGGGGGSKVAPLADSVERIGMVGALRGIGRLQRVHPLARRVGAVKREILAVGTQLEVGVEATAGARGPGSRSSIQSSSPSSRSSLASARSRPRDSVSVS